MGSSAPSILQEERDGSHTGDDHRYFQSPLLQRWLDTAVAILG